MELNPTHLYHVGLVSTSPSVKLSDLQDVAAALNKQQVHDFLPAWSRMAQVTAYADPKQVPIGVWPMTVMDQLDDPNAAGYHSDTNNQPFAVVQSGQDWPVTASHELVEMATDPFGNTLRVGQILGQMVRVLEEPADPVEAHSYKIDGIPVSEFVFPSYYGHAVPGRWYSLFGSVKSPLSVDFGGYLSWLDKDGNWWQSQYFDGSAPQIVELGPDTQRPKHMPLRAYIDSLMLAKGLGIHGKKR